MQNRYYENKRIVFWNVNESTMYSKAKFENGKKIQNTNLSYKGIHAVSNERKCSI